LPLRTCLLSGKSSKPTPATSFRSTLGRSGSGGLGGPNRRFPVWLHIRAGVHRWP
jgi:hypothetical protein